MRTVVKVVEKPEELAAIRWDGTPDGAVKVYRFLRGFYPRSVVEQSRRLDSDGDSTTLLISTLGDRNRELIRPGEWILIRQRADGGFFVISNEEMETKYVVIAEAV